MNKVLIVGAGASGLVAAIKAAENGAKVTIIEKNNKVGKKLLATGNGRCNLTNMDLSASKYRGSDISFVEYIINKYKTEDIIDFFEDLSMKTKSINGYVYPYSLQASTVVEKLVNKCVSLGVEILLNTECISIEAANDKFNIEAKMTIDSKKVKFLVDRVIVATGLVASVGVKSDKININDIFAIKQANNFGHKINHIVPGLTGLKCKNNYLSKVSGVRWESKVSTYIDDKMVFEDVGELQFADYGISGIVVFQNARFAAYGLVFGRKTEVFVDMMPEFDAFELENYLKYQFSKFENMSIYDLLTGLFNSKLVTYILLNANINGSVKAKNFDCIKALISTIKNHRLPVVGTRGFEFAQVCAGGIDTKDIKETMESKLMKGIYFVGEALDIDGMCGGYNLHFAFATGIEAGVNAGIGDKNDKN